MKVAATAFHANARRKKKGRMRDFIWVSLSVSVVRDAVPHKRAGGMKEAVRHLYPSIPPGIREARRRCPREMPAGIPSRRPSWMTAIRENNEKITGGDNRIPRFAPKLYKL